MIILTGSESRHLFSVLVVAPCCVLAASKPGRTGIDTINTRARAMDPTRAGGLGKPRSAEDAGPRVNPARPRSRVMSAPTMDPTFYRSAADAAAAPAEELAYVVAFDRNAQRHDAM